MRGANERIDSIAVGADGRSEVTATGAIFKSAAEDYADGWCDLGEDA